MVQYAYSSKVLRVDLTRKKAKVISLPEEWKIKYLGGRGFGARLYYDEIAPDTEPLSPENKLYFITGPLTGCPVFGPSKYHLVTKSPLTGKYLCSNAGGFFGVELKKAGYDGLIVEGKADKLTLLKIVDEDVELKDVESLRGLTSSETQKAAKEEIDDPLARVVSIGPAGENMVEMACIMSDNRSFGRGGCGAVMGSKNLKAIAIRGTGKVTVKDVEKIKEIMRNEISALRETTREHTLYGSAQYIDVLYELGAYPLYNYTRTRVEGDSIKEISPINLRKKYLIRSTACFGCPVACGKLCRAFDNSMAELEYETIWALGPQCGIFDLNIIIKANEICDEYGIDTISSGNTIGFAMELYERGIISKRDTGGVELKFGSGEALITTLKQIALKTSFGSVLGKGSKRASAIIGKNSEFYAMQVKGLEMTAYEPRAFYGMGLAFTTSNRGACHNVGGWTIRDELIQKKVDRFAVKGKGILVKNLQDVRGYIDAIGICTIPRRAMHLTDKPAVDVINLATGMDFAGQLLLIGERIYNLERLILVREGVTRKDDDLPQRIKIEPIPDGPAKGHRISQEILDEMLDEYYLARGWNRNGVPTQAKIEQLAVL
ncbi:MAG: aldehyde ferredoxin oxidoreductase family protein [Candidatus Bathyarchaeia archaeon]